jgi:hypothetical protein
VRLIDAEGLASARINRGGHCEAVAISHSLDYLKWGDLCPDESRRCVRPRSYFISGIRWKMPQLPHEPLQKSRWAGMCECVRLGRQVCVAGCVPLRGRALELSSCSCERNDLVGTGWLEVSDSELSTFPANFLSSTGTVDSGCHRKFRRKAQVRPVHGLQSCPTAGPYRRRWLLGFRRKRCLSSRRQLTGYGRSNQDHAANREPRTAKSETAGP